MPGSLASALRRCVVPLAQGDFCDFGVSFAATVAWRYTRWGGPRLSVQGEPLVVLTRGPSGTAYATPAHRKTGGVYFFF